MSQSAIELRLELSRKLAASGVPEKKILEIGAIAEEPDSDKLVERIAAMIIKAQPYRVYPVTVISLRGFDRFVQAGKYDAVSPELTEDRFQLGRGSGHTCVSGVAVFTIGHNATTEEVLTHRKFLGLESIGMEHLLALGVLHPMLQQELRFINNLDTVWVEVTGKGKKQQSKKHFSCLTGDEEHRGLMANPEPITWPAHEWFCGLCHGSVPIRW